MARRCFASDTIDWLTLRCCASTLFNATFALTLLPALVRQVRGIPSVVVLSAVDGHVVTKDGRNAIAAANSLDDLFDGTAAADDSTNEGGCVVA